jgi:hypothetical protein
MSVKEVRLTIRTKIGEFGAGIKAGLSE